MSATLRRGGSAVTFTWPVRSELACFDLDILAKHRFRTIDAAASEEVSAGWCTPQDPSGDAFEATEMDAGDATWLRIRIDTKKMPADQFAMRLAAEERAKGKRLTGRERRELRDALHEQLLPRLLPKTSFVDLLQWTERRRVVLLAGGKAARDIVRKLFLETFGVVLEQLTPGAMAVELLGEEHGDAVQQLQPTRWPVAKGGK